MHFLTDQGRLEAQQAADEVGLGRIDSQDGHDWLSIAKLLAQTDQSSDDRLRFRIIDEAVVWQHSAQIGRQALALTRIGQLEFKTGSPLPRKRRDGSAGSAQGGHRYELKRCR